jgi:Protein of unknown function (DUF664)
MTDADAAQSLLIDSFSRIRDLIQDLTDGLSDEVANYRPDAEANSIGWLVWHLSRVQDDHVATLAGVEQVWPQWRDRFALPFDDWATGYGQTPDQVAQVRVSGELLGGYHADVHQLTQQYLLGLTEAELDRVVDKRWDPPVTAAVRIVSVVGDALQHLGQAAYVRGLAERRERIWHTSSSADR